MIKVKVIIEIADEFDPFSAQRRTFEFKGLEFESKIRFNALTTSFEISDFKEIVSR